MTRALGRARPEMRKWRYVPRDGFKCQLLHLRYVIGRPSANRVEAAWSAAEIAPRVIKGSRDPSLTWVYTLLLRTCAFRH
jgi:hypothetical protein